MTQDMLYRYVFDDADVRGELVQLDKSYQQIINAHPYPLAVKNLLGQLLAATSLLTATLKFEGDISIQLQGNGTVSLAVINGNHQQQMRGLARWSGDIDDNASLKQLLGNGHMIITLTPVHGERYQGVVALDKPNLAECVEQYFQQSEQLPTKIWLFCENEKAAGIFLQVLPTESENDAYDHLAQLTNTITANELVNLPAEQILHRLYHQEQVRLFDPIAVSFQCHCSRERSAAAIRTVNKQEIDAILVEDGQIEMGCEYCNSKYIFDSIDIEGIFSDQQPPSSKQ